MRRLPGEFETQWRGGGDQRENAVWLCGLSAEWPCAGEAGTCLLHVAFFGGHVVDAALLLFVREDRPSPGDRIEDEERIEREPLFVRELYLPRGAAQLRADERNVAVPTGTRRVRRPGHVVIVMNAVVALRKVRAKRHRDCLVLICHDVLLEQHALQLFLLHLETRGAAIWRTQATELVHTRLWQRTQRRAAVNVARPHLKSHFVEQAQFTQPLASYRRTVPAVSAPSSTAAVRADTLRSG